MADKVVREVSSALEVKVAVDLKAYGTISRELKAKWIHDLRGRQVARGSGSVRTDR